MFWFGNTNWLGTQRSINLGLVLEKKKGGVAFKHGYREDSIYIVTPRLPCPVTAIATCNFASMGPGVRLSAKGTSQLPPPPQKGRARRAGGGKAARTNSTWPEISLQTKVWEHLIRKLQLYLQGGYEKLRKGIYCPGAKSWVAAAADGEFTMWGGWPGTSKPWNAGDTSVSKCS